METTFYNNIATIEPQSLPKKERIITFDIAKGIGILLVVFAHVNYTPILLNFIYSFHMPLFFIISGMFFRKEKYGSFANFAKHRFITLICPYLFFYTVSMIIRFSISIIHDGFSDALISEYLMYFLQMFIAERSAAMVNTPLWFVPSLFVVECIYYFISKLKPALVVLMCSILACTGWFLESSYISLEGVVIPWNLPTVLFAVGFYAIGNLSFDEMRNMVSKIQKSRYKAAISIGGALLCVLILVPLVQLNGKISLGSRHLNNGFILYCSGIIGSAGILFVSILLEKSRFLRFCGQNSFCIMSTHVLIRYIYLGLYGVFGFELFDETKLSETIAPFLVVLVLSLICTLIYNKLTAVFLKKRVK